MPLHRRDLFKASGAALGVALLDGCSRREPVFIAQPLERGTVPAGASSWRTTVCGQCEARCGITVRTVDGDAKKIEGNAEHPTSRGGVCALGHSALQGLYDPDRVTVPLRRATARGAGVPTRAETFQQATWEEALQALGEAIAAARAAASPARIAVVSGEGGAPAAIWSRLLVALGAPALVRDEPFDQLVEREAARRVLGAPVVPSYDLAGADFVLGLGAAFLDRWRSPVAYARALVEMRSRGGRFVHAEPRLSLTAAAADLWLPVRPGSEGVLARALAGAVLASGRVSAEAAARYRQLFPGDPPDLPAAAAACDVAEERLAATARALLAAQRPLVVAGGSAALVSDGLANVAAGLALDVLLGAVGRQGGVFAERGIDWHAALAPGAPEAEPLDALRRRLLAREVDVLLVAEADPLRRAPRAWGLDDLVGGVPLVVSIASVLDDTALAADWVLPAQVDLERHEVAVAHPAAAAGGVPVLSLGRPAVDPLGEARHAADVALALAAGQEALEPPLPWQSFQDAAFEAVGADTRFVASPRDARRTLDRAARAGFLVASSPADPSTPQAPSAPFPEPGDALAAEVAGAGDRAALRLVPFESVKSADGRGANRPWLQELPDPLSSVLWGSWVELAPADAAALGVHQGDWVRLRPAGAVDAEALEAGVVVSPAVRPGTVGAPLGHGHRGGGRWARDRGANVHRLAGGRAVDGTAAPAIGELRVTLERMERPPRRLVLYRRELGAAEHLPRGWGAHEPAPARARGASRPESAASGGADRQATAEPAEGGSQ
jgi:anaerobic selenocysteine-containing dehydrogenase